MSDRENTQTMVRTRVAVDDVGFDLAQGQSIDELKRQIEDAIGARGRFVDFVVVGNRIMSVLITSASRVAFSIETVQYDPRDDGDDAAPFGGVFDLI